jgi:hypothetical protein
MLCFWELSRMPTLDAEDSGGCARGDLNQAQPTLVLPDSAGLSVK